MRDRSSRTAISFLRVIVALLLLVHGSSRLRLGTLDEFGGFLDGVGLPLGIYFAWGLTLFEVVGAALLALGKWRRPLAILFAAELGGGIILVHAQEGWFVVGAGRNGMEYSFLLIAVLLVVAYVGSPRRRRPRVTI